MERFNYVGRIYKRKGSTKTMTNDNKLTVKLFTKDGCAPCSTLGFTFQMAEQQLDETGAEIVRYNIDNEPNLIGEYNLATEPVQIVEKGGEGIKRNAGRFEVRQLVKYLTGKGG